VSFDELFNENVSGTCWPCAWHVCVITVMEARGRGVGMTIDRCRKEGGRNRKMKLLMTGARSADSTKLF
jgi:hypothetical protein